jgi:hypothetical protein
LPRGRHQRNPRLERPLPDRGPRRLRSHQPELIRDDALAQLSPVGHAHVNPNGRYRFDVSALPAGQLRPLRERTDGDERTSRPSPPILVNGDKH